MNTEYLISYMYVPINLQCIWKDTYNVTTVFPLLSATKGNFKIKNSEIPTFVQTKSWR